jgi:hypothetical protein
MAVVLGTNAGFVSAAPTSDPSDAEFWIDNKCRAIKTTSPASSTKCVEIGVWISNATEDATLDLGLYSSSGTQPNSRLGHATTSKGTSGGVWKSVSVDISITEGTDYWVACGCTDTTTTTSTDYDDASGSYAFLSTGTTSLPATWSSSTNGTNICWAFYAVWTAGAPPTPGIKINIGDVWKDVTAVQVNIGDVWKTVTKGEVNIGDVWKTFYGS